MFMKINIGLWQVLMACVGLALVAPFGAQAQSESGRFYVKADLGGNYTRDTSLKELFGESLTPGSKVKFDPGGRFGIAAGYYLTHWLAAEVESGVMANEIDSITGASRVDAVFSNVPLLFNLRLQCPHADRVVPYIGGGVGASFPTIDIEKIDSSTGRRDGSDADAVFAYQAFAGLRFKLNHRMGLSLEYHYFHADGAEWGDSSDRLRFGATETHAVSIAFDFHF